MIRTRSLALLLSLLLVATAANSAPLPTSNCPSCPAFPQPSSLEARAGEEEGVSGAKDFLDGAHGKSEVDGWRAEVSKYRSYGSRLTKEGQQYVEGLEKLIEAAEQQEELDQGKAEVARLLSLIRS